MTDSILVPLSELDERWDPESRINMGYVVETLDVDALRGAVDRVVDRWRLLAGRLEESSAKKTPKWCLRVPLGNLDGEKFKFTHRTVSAASSTPLLHLNGTSTEVLVRPPREYFCDPTTPHTLSKYASTKSPLLSIHVTQLVDCVCIGISFPHGVFDGVGMGQVIRAIDAELNGRDWTPTPFSSTNPMQGFLSELVEAETIDQEGSPALDRVKATFVPASLWAILAVVVSIAYEFIWHTSRTKALYIGEDTLKQIVNPAKASTNSDAGWISTGDILVGWFLKAAYLDEVNTNDVSVISIVTARKTLEAKGEVFAKYPHNATLPCVLPNIPFNTVVSRPIGQVANIHREAVGDARKLGFIQAYHRWTGTLSGLVPVRTSGVDAWLFSNQVIGRMDEIYFGSPTYALWHWHTTIEPDHVVVINKFNGGYILQACLRKTRWASIEREVERMKFGTPRVA